MCTLTPHLFLSLHLSDLEFPGWTSRESIKAYLTRVRSCLTDDRAKQALDDHFPLEAIDMLFERFESRFRIAITCIVSEKQPVSPKLGVATKKKEVMKLLKIQCARHLRSCFHFIYSACLGATTLSPRRPTLGW